MSFEEIGNLTLKQAQILLNEHAGVKVERMKAMQETMKKNEKGIFPVIDISAPIWE